MEVQGAPGGESLQGQAFTGLKIMGVCIQAWFGQQFSLLI